MSREDQKEEGLIRKISPKDKGKGIAIAKSKGLLKQDGKSLKLTAKGKSATRKKRKKK